MWRVRRWRLLNQALLALGMDPVTALQRDSSCHRAVNIFVPFMVLPITASIDAFRRALRRPRRTSEPAAEHVARDAKATAGQARVLTPEGSPRRGETAARRLKRL
jgi:hypothetical protein